MTARQARLLRTIRVAQLAIFVAGMAFALSCVVRLTADGWAVLAAVALAALVLLARAERTVASPNAPSNVTP